MYKMMTLSKDERKMTNDTKSAEVNQAQGGGVESATKELDALAELQALRARMLPMFQAVAREYRTRTDPGYPVVVDNVELGGYFGTDIDPNYGLYIMTDGAKVFAQINLIGWRTDVRSS